MSQRASHSTARVRAAAGRPRKLTRQSVVDAAIQVLKEDGFGALNARALALRLAVNHATLYNYFDRIEDIETRALQRLMANVCAPSLNNPAPMRTQLIEHLLALRELQVQHPHVLHAPVGSPAWRSYARLQDRVLRVLRPYGVSLPEVVAAYTALTGVVATSAERARRIGGDYLEVQRRAIGALPQDDSELLRAMLADMSAHSSAIDLLTELLNHLIDRLLPAIDRSSP